MRAGRLRHLITIQKPKETQDATGDVPLEYEDHAQVLASIEPLVGREFFAARTEVARVTTKIRMRWLAGITPKMRVLYNEQVYDISSVIRVDERRHEMILMCDERVEEPT